MTVPSLRKLKRLPAVPGARERTLEALETWRKADEDLRKICKERGIPVPVLVC